MKVKFLALLIIIIALIIFTISLLPNKSIDNNKLSIIIKNNKPCFYIDDRAFTHTLPDKYSLRIWVQDLTLLGKADNSDYGLNYYHNILIPTPKNKETCFYLPTDTTLEFDKPYNINTTHQIHSNFCLVSKSTVAVNKVGYRIDSQGVKDPIPICTKEPFTVEKTLLEKMSDWFYKIFH